MDFFNQKSHDIPPTNMQNDIRYLHNKNGLLNGKRYYYGLIASKTGWTTQAKHTLVTDPSIGKNGFVNSVTITNQGTGYTVAPAISFLGDATVEAEAEATISGGMITSIMLTNKGAGYAEAPMVLIIGDGIGGAAVANIKANIDTQDNFGDNNKFRKEAKTIIFTEDNPFGEL
jgi:hypothetical protein